MLAPRFATFKVILERLKRIIVGYNIMPFENLNKSVEFIKVKELGGEEIMDLVQDDDIHHIEDERF